jgi:predicted transcriptional regulator
MRVLLSIKPEHALNILSGHKTYEFRRRLFSRDVTTVVIYCTRPIGKLLGEFLIEEFIESTPASLWRRTAKGSGISKAYFDECFAGRERAFAIQIGKVTRYEEQLEPDDWLKDFTPPQSYMYVTSERLKRAPVKLPALRFQ